MREILKLRTWQIFLLIISPWMIGDIINEYILKSAFYIIGYALYFAYYIFTYQVCEHYLDNKKGDFFLFSVFFLIILFGILIIVLEPGQSIELTGFIGLLVSIVFTGSVLYTLFYITSLQIDFVKRKEKVSTLFRIIYIFCFIFLPIGIWFLYPQLKNAVSVRQESR